MGTTNGDAKKETSEEQVEDKKEESEEGETKEETTEDPADATVEDAEKSTTSSKKEKTNMMGKIKKRLSMRTQNFLKRKSKKSEDGNDEFKNEADESKNEDTKEVQK